VDIVSYAQRAIQMRQDKQSTGQLIDVRTWAEFESKVRKKGGKLLANLDGFRDPVLVGGCQRSGTTAVARMIRSSNGIEALAYRVDDELDGALILTGLLEPDDTSGRWCFQTTYLNDQYLEYLEHRHARLIWVIRDPVAIVESMLNNWSRAALNRLFLTCGVTMLKEDDHLRYKRFGKCGISPLSRACMSYNAKARQIIRLYTSMNPGSLFVLNYNDMVGNPGTAIPAMYNFIDIPYQQESNRQIGKRQRSRKWRLRGRMSDRAREIVLDRCQSAFEEIQTFVSYRC